MLVFAFSILLIFSQPWALPTASQDEGINPYLTYNYDHDQLEQLAQFALHTTQNTIAGQRTSCTLENMRIRRNWRAFSTEEKKAYIESVLCLQALPSRTPPDLAPGAKTRYDDFVATHINQTDFIHRSVCFTYAISSSTMGMPIYGLT